MLRCPCSVTYSNPSQKHDAAVRTLKLFFFFTIHCVIHSDWLWDCRLMSTILYSLPNFLQDEIIDNVNETFSTVFPKTISKNWLFVRKNCFKREWGKSGSDCTAVRALIFCVVFIHLFFYFIILFDVNCFVARYKSGRIVSYCKKTSATRGSLAPP